MYSWPLPAVIPEAEQDPEGLPGYGSTSPGELQPCPGSVITDFVVVDFFFYWNNPLFLNGNGTAYWETISMNW